MMLEVAAHKAENRMSLQALAACMAPLLLRPLVGGPLVGGRVDGDFNSSSGGPGDSFQLLQAAAAANSAQNIVIIFLEEFDHIFDVSPSTFSLLFFIFLLYHPTTSYICNIVGNLCKTKHVILAHDITCLD